MFGKLLALADHTGEARVDGSPFQLGAVMNPLGPDHLVALWPPALDATLSAVSITTLGTGDVGRR